MMRRPKLKLLSLILVLAISGCRDQGTGHVHGPILSLQDCEAQGATTTFEPYVLPLRFMAMARSGDVLLLTFSDQERRWPVPDTFVVTLDDVGKIQDEIAAQGFAERSIAEDDVGVTLGLLDTCEMNTQPLRASQGTLRMTALATSKGEKVAGEITFDLVDLRDGTVAGTELTATFSFRVMVGTPYQPFVDPFDTQHR